MNRIRARRTVIFATIVVCFLCRAGAHGHMSQRRPLMSGTIRSSWTIDNGLPQNTVYKLLQSRQGYLWIATQEGVARFDGIRFTVFNRRTVPGFPSNTVTTMLEDRTGRVWFGSNAGLAYFSGRTIHLLPGILTGRVIRSMIEDADSSLIVGTTRGAYVVEGDSARPLSLPLYANDWDVRALLRHSDGSLWIGTEQNGLFRWDGRSMEHYSSESGLGGVSVSTLFQDISGNLWVGMSGAGLRVLRDGRFTAIPLAQARHPVTVNTLLPDTSGGMLVGSSAGLIQVSIDAAGISATPFNTDHGGPVWTVTSLLFDREGSLWIGTFGRGLHQFAGSSFASSTPFSEVDDSFVFCVFEDSRGRIWVGTDDRGAIVWSPSEGTKRITDRHGLPDNSVFTIYEDSRGTIWMGTTGGGLVEYRDRVRRVFTTENGMPNNQIRALREDREGFLWIGTRSGLCRMKDGLIENFTAAQGLTSLFVHTLLMDRAGHMWAGTLGGGALRFDEAQFTPFTTSNGMPSNDVRAIHEDEDGTLWFGTEGGGLVRLRGAELRTITTEQGLSDDAIFSIQEDGLDHFWFSSNHGLSRVSRRDLRGLLDGDLPHLNTTSYGRPNGMRDEECNAGQPAALRDRRDHLWYPTIRGVVVIHPGQLMSISQPPLIVIESVVGDGRSIPPDRSVHLPPGTNEVEIQYTGLSYLAPEAVEFRYRLEGLQNDWVLAGTRRTAFYTNLDPGEYVFRVTARNADGLWNERGLSVPLVVHARFYQTRWFAIVAVVLLLAAVSVVSSVRVRRLQARRDLLEREVRDRTAELENQMAVARDANEFKSQLLDLAAHDLKSPLISIRGFAQLLRTELGTADATRDSLEAIQRLSQSMLSLINELLDVSSIEQGRLQLVRRQVDLSTVASSVAELHRNTAQRKQQRLVVTPAAPGTCLVLADVGRLQTCVENLVTNALKYAPASSTIEVRVEKFGAEARVSVLDEGPGLTEDDHRKVFGRFQRLSARPTGGEPSTGLGLSIVKQIVELHGGRVNVETRATGGCMFFIDLPLVS